MLCRSRSLTGLATDVLALVLHALALVGLGRAEAADVRGDLADEGLVRAADREARGILHLDRDARRRIEMHGMAEAQLQHELLALHRRAIAGADDLQRLAEAGRDAGHHVRDLRAHGAERRVPRDLLGAHLHFVPLDHDGGAGEDGVRQLRLGALHLHGAAGHRHGDPGRDRDGLLADSRHLDALPYQTWQTSSPPRPASRASRSVRRPRDVDTTDTPRPPITRGMRVLGTYTRRPGLLTRLTPVITHCSSAVYLRYTRRTPWPVSSMTLKLLMKRSRSSSLAISCFSDDDGTSSLRCFAPMALRMQVRKSATGSLTDMNPPGTSVQPGPRPTAAWLIA